MKDTKSILWLLTTITLVSCNLISSQNIQATRTPTKPLVIDIGDGGLVSQEPCGPPCYQGVQIGMSRSEAISTIQSVEWGVTCLVNPPYIHCLSPDSLIDFDSSKTKVDLIIFHPANITVDAVIDKYGPPNRWNIEVGVDELGHTAQYYSMRLYYDSLKTIVELESQDKQSRIYTITAESKIEKVIYQEVWWLDIENVWNGYGEYQSR